GRRGSERGGTGRPRARHRGWLAVGSPGSGGRLALGRVRVVVAKPASRWARGEVGLRCVMPTCSVTLVGHRWGIAILVVVAVALGAGASAHAATIAVTNGNDSGAGSLRAAV